MALGSVLFVSELFVHGTSVLFGLELIYILIFSVDLHSGIDCNVKQRMEEKLMVKARAV